MPAPFDAHVHAFSTGHIRERGMLTERDAAFSEMYGDPGASMASPADVLSMLDREGFGGALVAGFAFATDRDCRAHNDEVPLTVDRGSGGSRALAAINPAAAGWERTAELALEGGAAGFGELRPGNQGWDPLGREARRLYGMCRDAGALLLWHVSEPLGHAYPGKGGGITPWDLASVASAEPGLRQIAAHLGGGLPFFALMPEVRAALATTWFDTAAASLLYDNQAVARVIDLVGAERVVFGSDYPLLSPRRHLDRLRATLNPVQAEAVCGGNVHELLGGPGMR